jgi:GAF domain
MPQPPQVLEQSDRMASGSRDLPGRQRQDVLSSWKRSLLAGLAPERFDVPHLTDVDEDGPLAWSAAPVMARLAGELEGTGIAILLADSRGHIISRRSGERHVLRLLDKVDLAPGSLYDEGHLGTNAIGTAVVLARPSVVVGPEHFADALGTMACAASPVTDAAGQLVGVLDLTCEAGDFNPLMLPLVKHAVAEITAELAAGRLAIPQGSQALRTGPEDAIPPIPGWRISPTRRGWSPNSSWTGSPTGMPARGSSCPRTPSTFISARSTAGSVSGHGCNWPGSPVPGARRRCQAPRRRQPRHNETRRCRALAGLNLCLPATTRGCGNWPESPRDRSRAREGFR